MPIKRFPLPGLRTGARFLCRLPITLFDQRLHSPLISILADSFFCFAQNQRRFAGPVLVELRKVFCAKFLCAFFAPRKITLRHSIVPCENRQKRRVEGEAPRAVVCVSAMSVYVCPWVLGRTRGFPGLSGGVFALTSRCKRPRGGTSGAAHGSCGRCPDSPGCTCCRRPGPV